MAESNAARDSSLKEIVVALNKQNQILGQVLPAVQSTATAATAGTAGAPPAQVVGYLNVTLPNGSSAKVPYYAP